MEAQMGDGKGRRARRKFTDEYKASAVRLVLEEEQASRRWRRTST